MARLTRRICLCRWVRSGLLNRIVGQQFTGVEGSAAAGVLSAVVYVPVGIITLLIHPPTPTALAFGATAGVLAAATATAARPSTAGRWLYRVFLFASAAGIALAAHIGARLVWGADFLHL